MSQTLHLRTVAEGVEQPEQADWLVQANCSYGQGFLWSKPVCLDEARELLTKTAWLPHVDYLSPAGLIGTAPNPAVA